MSEFICPQTQESCEFHGLCELKSNQFKAMAKYWSARTRELHELHLESIGENRFTLQGEGNKPRKLTAEEIDEIRDAEPSADYAADEAEMDAHLTITQMLPIKANREDSESPHDTYDQLTGAICLYGTARAVEQILDLDDGEKEIAIARLIFRTSGLEG